MELGKFFFSLIFPEAEVQNSKWWPIWKETSEKTFLKNAKLAYSILIVSYILHYFFVDIPLGITEGNTDWLYYRFGLASYNILALLYTLRSKENNSIIADILFAVDGIAICYLQSRSTLWYSGVPYFWGILFAILFSVFINFSNLGSLLFAGVLLSVQYYNLKTNTAPNIIWGAYAVAIFVVFYIKSKKKHEIASFLANFELIDLQEKIIETQKNLSEQIQAFLPKKIKERLISEINNGQKNVVQAVDEILRPVEKNIVALFSDIRGYTQSSKNIDYVGTSAIPNIKSMTEIIEDKDGIPRLIGDLIFSYFDEPDSNKNIYNSFKASVEIIYANHTMNMEKPENMRIQRYVLLDTGNAYVGNIGSATSAREITALGTCVNKLSRIDMWTKNSDVKLKLGYSSIIITDDFYSKLKEVFPSLKLQAIDIMDNSIKDFPEISKLYLFKGDFMFNETVSKEAA